MSAAYITSSSRIAHPNLASFPEMLIALRAEGAFLTSRVRRRPFGLGLYVAPVNYFTGSIRWRTVWEFSNATLCFICICPSPQGSFTP